MDPKPVHLNDSASNNSTQAIYSYNPYKYYAPHYGHSTNESKRSERVFNKQLADKINWINKMTEKQLLGTLKYHNLDVRGSLDVLRKRLKSYIRQNLVVDVPKNEPILETRLIYSYFLIIDFEATCEAVNSPDYQHEIIEFPIILYDVVLGRVVDTFHSYCHPVINPILTDFCLSLTKIDQHTTDNANLFCTALQNAEEWMAKRHLYERSFAVVCDCNADMAKFMRIQCAIDGIEVPKWAQQWVNLRKSFRNFYQIPNEQKLTMQSMLGYLGLEFEGQQHSGLTDAHNILRIVETLLRDKCELRINEKLSLHSPPHYTASVSRKEAETIQPLGPDFKGGCNDSTFCTPSDYCEYRGAESSSVSYNSGHLVNLLQSTSFQEESHSQ